MSNVKLIHSEWLVKWSTTPYESVTSVLVVNSVQTKFPSILLAFLCTSTSQSNGLCQTTNRAPNLRCLMAWYILCLELEITTLLCSQVVCYWLQIKNQSVLKGACTHAHVKTWNNNSLPQKIKILRIKIKTCCYVLWKLMLIHKFPYFTLSSQLEKETDK